MDQDRRVADEKFRMDLAERLAVIEVSQKLYHDELKSICEALLKDINTLKASQADVELTLYGNRNTVGLLEQFRRLLLKIGIGVVIATGIVSVAGRLISPLYDKVVKDWATASPTEKVKHSHKVKIQEPDAD